MEGDRRRHSAPHAPHSGNGHADTSSSHESPRARRRQHLSGLLLELVMIMIGVFLGATAEQLRESRHEHELATASLENFRREVMNNRAAILRYQPYHDSLGHALSVLADDPHRLTLRDFQVKTHFRGVESIDFDHTAWDLALATQSLSEIDPKLAFTLSRVYTHQQGYQRLEDQFATSAFAPGSLSDLNNATGLVLSMALYFGDVHYQEAAQLRMYDVVLKQLDSVLGPMPKVRNRPTAHDTTRDGGA